MTESTVAPTSAANARIVASFLDALHDASLDAADAMLADDLVYQDVGLPTIRGRRATMNVFRRMQGRIVFQVKTHRIAADGATVLTERTDALVVGPLRFQFWVCGVFEVDQGRITLWRDYFDFFNMFKAGVRAVAALAFPSLRPKL